MIDPKTRKVIVLENPLLPNRVKEMIAHVLFDNLQVRRLPSHLSARERCAHHRLSCRSRR